MCLYTWKHEWNHLGRIHPCYSELDGLPIRNKVFTEFKLGGYFHFANPEIPVFVDTFWEPHPERVRNAYLWYMGHPDDIPNGINTCLITRSNSKPFLKSEKWVPYIQRSDIFAFKRKEALRRAR